MGFGLRMSFIGSSAESGDSGLLLRLLINVSATSVRTRSMTGSFLTRIDSSPVKTSPGHDLIHRSSTTLDRPSIVHPA